VVRDRIPQRTWERLSEVVVSAALAVAIVSELSLGNGVSRAVIAAALCVSLIGVLIAIQLTSRRLRRRSRGVEEDVKPDP
jgi:multidrug efflux pump subunit AcrB